MEDVHRNRVKGIQDGEQQYLVLRKRVVYLDFFWSEKRSSEMIAFENGRDQMSLIPGKVSFKKMILRNGHVQVIVMWFGSLTFASSMSTSSGES